MQFRVALVCVFLLCFAIQGRGGLRSLIVAIPGCAGLRSLIVFCKSGLRWSAYSYCALQVRVALLCVVLLYFAIQGCAGLRILIVFCNSGLRWSAYSYCVLQLRVALVCVFFCVLRFRVGLHIPIVFLQFWVALVCVFLLCFAPQGCAGQRILFVFCKSGLRWSAYSYCVLHE